MMMFSSLIIKSHDIMLIFSHTWITLFSCVQCNNKAIAKRGRCPLSLHKQVETTDLEDSTIQEIDPRLV